MIGIVESGSTKTDWFFIDKDKKRYNVRTSGLSPYYQTNEELYRALQEELLPNVSFKVDKIFYYGTGCEPAAHKVKMSDALKSIFPEASAFVDHDLMAAAKALFGDNPGIACIAGTGSNTCYYDGKDVVKNINSLGFILGDEGSGSHMGKALITAYIRESLPLRLRQKFEEKYADRKDSIMQKIYKESFANRYIASYTTFIKENISDPFIQSIVSNSFNELFENCILNYENVKNLPIGFVGSVAYHFQDELHKAAGDKGLKISVIDPNPSEALLNYHVKKEFK